MLHSGVVARRWVGSVHRLGSSFDLNDTASWKQKAWRAHKWAYGWTRCVCQSLTRQWTPLRKPPGGRRSTCQDKSEPDAPQRTLLGIARPGAGSRPGHTEETAGNSGSVESGKLPRIAGTGRTTDSGSSGGGLRGWGWHSCRSGGERGSRQGQWGCWEPFSARVEKAGADPLSAPDERLS